MVRNLILPAALVWLSAASLSAEDALFGQLFGNGVHAFFSRDYVKAHEYLTTAIEGGTKDPRSYYFRGMAYLKLGREEEAEIDFQKGAELESRDINRLYHVARSLERIQGRTRLKLETYRLEARMAARQRAEQLHKARYEAIRAEEHRLLGEQIEPATEAPAGRPALPATEATGESPFGIGPLQAPPTEWKGEPSARPPIAPAAEPAVGPAAEPAAEPALVPGAASEPNPFDLPVLEPAARPPAEPAAQPPTEPAAEPRAEPGNASPFGTSLAPGAGAAKKPGGIFGAILRSASKAVGVGSPEGPAEPGAGPAEPAADDDPFGDLPEPPAAAPAEPPAAAPAEPVAEPPLDPSDNPFADENQAAPAPPEAKPADNSDDPFAG